MAKKFTNRDPYSADLDALWAMISTQDYWERKFAFTGGMQIQVEEWTASDTAVTVKTTRNVPADLPGFAKKIVGDTNHVTQTERWTRGAAAITGTIEIAVKNVPGGTTGTMSITPSGAGASWAIDWDTKVPLPLVGGKLEGIMVDETRRNVTQEKQFNDTWLAENA